MIFVPHRTVICEHVLQSQGLLTPSVSLYDYKLDLIPFDTDLLSMELGDSFQDLYLDGDRTVLYFIARCPIRIRPGVRVGVLSSVLAM